MSSLEQCPPLNNVPLFEKAYYIKKEHYLRFWTFEIARFPNVHGLYLRKYGSSWLSVDSEKYAVVNHVVKHEQLSCSHFLQKKGTDYKYKGDI